MCSLILLSLSITHFTDLQVYGSGWGSGSEQGWHFCFGSGFCSTESHKKTNTYQRCCVCVKICFSVILFLQWAAQSRLGNTNCICPQGHVRHIYIHFEYCILIIRFSFFVEMLLGCKHNIVTAYIFYLIFY